MSKVLILDFDGTMTNAEAEGAPFRQGYLEDLAILTGRPLAELLPLAERFEAEVAANPQAHGWYFNGRIVAPATVDPFLRVMPTARMLFDHFGVFDSDLDRSRLCDGVLYKYNYQKTGAEFRPGAREALVALTGKAAFIVTNSHTVPVQKKLRTLDAGTGELDWLVARVHGRAKKYIIDDAFDRVPEALEIQGLTRPVLLRRRHYHDVVRGLLDSVGADFEDLVVIGDIFELDLALPLALGATVGLVANEFTPDYERCFLEAHPRGRVLSSLAEIQEVFDG